MVNTTDQFHAKDNVVMVDIVKRIVHGSTDGCLERKTMISEDNIGVRWVSDGNNIMDNHPSQHHEHHCHHSLVGIVKRKDAWLKTSHFQKKRHDGKRGKRKKG